MREWRCRQCGQKLGEILPTYVHLAAGRLQLFGQPPIVARCKCGHAAILVPVVHAEPIEPGDWRCTACAALLGTKHATYLEVALGRRVIWIRPPVAMICACGTPNMLFVPQRMPPATVDSAESGK